MTELSEILEQTGAGGSGPGGSWNITRVFTPRRSDG
jgi:hypothetical protein